MLSFPWKQWVTVAIRLQIKLLGWSVDVYPPPGPDLKVDDLKAHEWKALGLPIINEVSQLDIIPWTAGKCSANINFIFNVQL